MAGSSLCIIAREMEREEGVSESRDQTLSGLHEEYNVRGGP